MYKKGCFPTPPIPQQLSHFCVTCSLLAQLLLVVEEITDLERTAIFFFFQIYRQKSRQPLEKTILRFQVLDSFCVLTKVCLIYSYADASNGKLMSLTLSFPNLEVLNTFSFVCSSSAPLSSVCSPDAVYALESANFQAFYINFTLLKTRNESVSSYERSGFSSLTEQLPSLAIQ